MIKKSLTVMVSALCLAGVAQASGVKIYTCQSADEQLVVHVMPKSLRATLHQADAERGLYNLSCTAGTGDAMLTCRGAETGIFTMYQNLGATYAAAGQVTELACRVSRID